MSSQPYAIPNGAQFVTASTTSAATAFTQTSGSQVRVVNYSDAQPVYIKFGASTVTAIAPTAGAGSPGVPFGQTEIFSISEGVTHFAVITASSTAVVEVSRSSGL